MSDNVFKFERPEAETPHLCGDAICLACKHEWASVVEKEAHQEIADGWLECPACMLVRGRFKNHYSQKEGTPIWICRCGNNLFEVSRDHVFCPNCGREQEFPR